MLKQWNWQCNCTLKLFACILLMHLLCVVYFFCSLFKIESGAKNTKISTNSLKKPLKKGWIFCFKKGCVKKNGCSLISYFFLSKSSKSKI